MSCFRSPSAPASGPSRYSTDSPCIGRPRGLIEAVAPVGAQHAGGDEIIDTATENLERMALGCNAFVGVVHSAGANAVRNRPGSAHAKSTYAWPVARNRASARRSRGPGSAPPPAPPA